MGGMHACKKHGQEIAGNRRREARGERRRDGKRGNEASAAKNGSRKDDGRRGRNETRYRA